MATFGIAPRHTGRSAWIAYGVALVFGPMIGTVMDLPQPILNLSPFTHVPLVPAQPFDATPLALMSAIAAGLTTLGILPFRRRDLSLFAEATGSSSRLPWRRTPRPTPRTP